MRLAGAALVVLFACGCYCQASIIQPSGPPSTATPSASSWPRHRCAAPGSGNQESRPRHRSSTLGASVELKDKRTATRVVIGQPPSVVFRFSEAQVQQLFGDALAALPPAPRHFLLYFANGSNQLAPASAKLFQKFRSS